MPFNNSCLTCVSKALFALNLIYPGRALPGLDNEEEFIDPVSGMEGWDRLDGWETIDSVFRIVMSLASLEVSTRAALYCFITFSNL